MSADETPSPLALRLWLTLRSDAPSRPADRRTGLAEAGKRWRAIYPRLRWRPSWGPTIIGTGTYAKPFGCSLERWGRIASFL
jgi:hypothetical protein